MATTTTTQVPSGSLDTAGISVTTATPTSENPRAGTIYNPTTFAAAQPVWFHPMHDGRFLMLNSQMWSAATPGGGIGSYASYTVSTSPSWVVVNGATGPSAQVTPTASVPFNSSPTSVTLTAAASRHPGYLFLLHAGAVGGQPQAILQHVSLTTSGSVTLSAEEIAPKVSTDSGTVVFSQGLQFADPYLILYGTDDSGTVYAIRKPWSKIGVSTFQLSPQTHRSLGATQVSWDYYTGTGYSPDSTQLAPLTTVDGTSLKSVEPISLAAVRNQLILATVTYNQEPHTYSAQVWSSKSGRPITAIGAPIALGNAENYLGGGLGLQPNLSAVSVPSGALAAIPYVVSSVVTSGQNTTLQNIWSTLPISV